MDDDKIEKAIGNVLTNLYSSFQAELFSKTQAGLEDYWHFKFSDKTSPVLNIYEFHEMLELYSDSCRRWEEHHNGPCCVVERVRDKYLIPKIREFVADLKTIMCLTYI